MNYAEFVRLMKYLRRVIDDDELFSSFKSACSVVVVEGAYSIQFYTTSDEVIIRGCIKNGVPAKVEVYVRPLKPEEELISTTEHEKKILSQLAARLINMSYNKEKN